MPIFCRYFGKIMLKCFEFLNFLSFLAKISDYCRNFHRTLIAIVRSVRSVADRTFQLRYVVWRSRKSLYRDAVHRAVLMTQGRWLVGEEPRFGRKTWENLKLAKFCNFLAGWFSAVSKRNFARKYAFDSIFQALQDLHPSAPLQSQNFRKKSV